MTGWLTRHSTALGEENRVALQDVLTRCPELDAAAGHVRDFGEMLTDRLGCRGCPCSERTPPGVASVRRQPGNEGGRALSGVAESARQGFQPVHWRMVREAGMVTAVR
ncbi:hypothetical protein AQJ27_47485 [Streptomyces olivochromogenes]|uniref:Uncharacterized protein n=1 Tax=Streptomyces olivochromogenes TaxID=1963 RepID=A0A250VW86_STROL|nr:hypothetical protein AQJ27_47485 [Streptomyces olivochromogenes]GAX58356.1 hypothetical protein SO3561_09929 [Streptomyces olivochromogenes]